MPRQCNTNTMTIPKLSEELAEFTGIMAGDGNSYLYIKGAKIRNYSITITCHSQNDFEYVTLFLSPLCKKLFGIKQSVRILKSSKGIQLRIFSKELVYILWVLGHPPGDKIKNEITIPSWVSINESYFNSYLRGFFDMSFS